MNWIKSFKDELEKLANMGRVNALMSQGMNKQEAMKKAYPQGMPNKGPAIPSAADNKAGNTVDASPFNTPG